MALTEKGNPYIVRKKDSEAENSEHLSEINEPTSGFGCFPGCNPVHNPGYNPHIPVPTYYPQHQAHKLVYNPIMQPCVIQHGCNYPFAPFHLQGPPHLKNFSNPSYQTNTWHNTPAHEKKNPIKAERDEIHRSFLEGERSYEDAKKKFTADEWSEKNIAGFAKRESFKPFRNPATWSANYDNRPPSAAPSNAPFVSTESSRERDLQIAVAEDIAAVSNLPMQPVQPVHNLPTDPGKTVRRLLDELPPFCRPPPPAAPIQFISPAPIDFVPCISPAPPRQPHGHFNWGA